MSQQYAPLPLSSGNHALLEVNEDGKHQSHPLALNMSEEDGGGRGNNVAAEHTTIDVTHRAEGNNKDDCSDLTDNNNGQEVEEQSRTFPQKLRDMLLHEENQNVISFLDHGKGFMIYKKRLFEAEVLPKYFKKSKFTSFTRKLNRWGFTRVSRGPEMGAYFHKLFLRDKPELLYQMTSNSRGRSRPLQYPTAILPNPQGFMTASSPFPLLEQNAMGGVTPNAMAMMPGIFPVNNGSAMTIQQQQALWQQQMHFMQFQMLQMQQQQQAMQAALFQQQQQHQQQHLLLPQQQAQHQQQQPSHDPQGGVASNMFQPSSPVMVPTMTANVTRTEATAVAHTAGTTSNGAGSLPAGSDPRSLPSGDGAAASPPAPGDDDASSAPYDDAPV